MARRRRDRIVRRVGPESPLQTPGSDDHPAADPWLWGAVLAALAVRTAPLVLWGTGGCVRDECLYRMMGQQIARGDGLTPHQGWLWAPGYPYLLAFFETVDTLQRVKQLQVVLGAGLVALAYALAHRLAGRRAARLAAIGVALHPTLIYFTGTLWTETVYAFLLLGLVNATLWARDGRGARVALPGALLAACVLFRGVALWTAPIVVLALIWPAEESWTEGLARRGRRAAGLLAVAAALVAPWSIHASRTHGGLVVSDASLGQVMWVGDNDFPTFTYDLGNGVTARPMADAHAAKGRPHCDDALPAAAWNACEVANGMAWIRAHPGEFVRRIPKRLAQYFNPNTFLTRHLRLGDWYAVPFAVKEGLVAWTALVSAAVVLGGAVGLWARARGPLGALVVGLTVYHLAVVAALFGLSRFRLPMEPLWIAFLAAAVADPRGTIEALGTSRPRAIGAAVTVVALAGLVAWYLPTGWPSVWR